MNKYTFSESEQLKIKGFDNLNQEWLEFIKWNRSKGGLTHSYDIVIGPVADDNTMETNQISFHTEEALESLSLVRRVAYE